MVGVHLIVKNSEGKIVMPSGRYSLACDAEAKWADHMTDIPSAASCEKCRATLEPVTPEPDAGDTGEE